MPGTPPGRVTPDNGRVGCAMFGSRCVATTAGTGPLIGRGGKLVVATMAIARVLLVAVATSGAYTFANADVAEHAEPTTSPVTCALAAAPVTVAACGASTTCHATVAVASDVTAACGTSIGAAVTCPPASVLERAAGASSPLAETSTAACVDDTTAGASITGAVTGSSARAALAAAGTTADATLTGTCALEPDTAAGVIEGCTTTWLVAELTAAAAGAIGTPPMDIATVAWLTALATGPTTPTAKTGAPAAEPELAAGVSATGTRTVLTAALSLAATTIRPL
jgi:hypothetical protein